MKEIILLGRGPSWIDCPFDAEVWASLSCYTLPLLPHRHFDKVFGFDPLDEELQKCYEKAMEEGVPVVSAHDYATEKYPVEEVKGRFGTSYFLNSVCWMIALALYKGYRRLRIYGIDQYRGMYLLQKGCVEFWCGIVLGMGQRHPLLRRLGFKPSTKIEIAPTSMLLSTYLREVVSVLGAGDEAELESVPEVMPYSVTPKQLVYPIRRAEE